MTGFNPRLILLLTLATAADSWQSANPCLSYPTTLYSSRATAVDGALERAVVISSPDHRKQLSIKTVEDAQDPDGLRINYTVRIAGKTYTAALPGFDGEAAWSPDSKAFAVTQTEGGGGIGSRVYVFYVNERGMRKLDVSSPIEKDFGSPVKCEVAVAPNTGLIRWKTDSSTLLVAVEVVPVSICDCMGTCRVYEMAQPGLTIVRTYSQTEAQKRFWDDLGCELRRAADDSCVQSLERYSRQRNAH